MGNENQKRFIWLVLCLIGIMLYAIDIRYIFDIEVSLVTVILVMMIQLFSPRVSLLTTILMYVAGVFLFKENPVYVIFVVEMLYLIGVKSKKSEANMVMADLFFWLTIGGMGYYMITQFVYSDATDQYARFLAYLNMINSIVNVLIADLIITYLPWGKWLSSIPKKYYYFTLKSFLFHIFMSIVSLAFIFNINANATIYTESISDSVQTISSGIKDAMVRELNIWEPQQVKKLLLFGTAEINKLDKFIQKKITNIACYYVVTNTKNQIIVSNMPSALKKDLFQIDTQEKSLSLNQNISKVKDTDTAGLYHESVNNKYFLYEERLREYPVKLYIKMPTIQYEGRVLGDYIDQLKLMSIIYLFIAGVCFIINRLVFEPLQFLAYTTTDMPKNIGLKEDIIWPKCYVYEVGMLIHNFKITAHQLKEMFYNTNRLNEELSAQSQKLRDSREKLRQLAYYDPLTQIGNRLSFKKYIEQIKTEELRDGSMVAILFMDMDRFKQINDTLGHDTGDELLKMISQKLETIKKPGINVFRLGGDEFVVTVKTIDIGLVYDTGDAVVQIFKEHIMIGETPLKMSGSIGVSIYPHNSNDINTVVKYADMAMYECKNQGGGYVQFFNPQIKKCFDEQVVIEQNMRTALANNDFEMYYQPKINFKKNKVTSMEALIRWKHEEQGFISPSIFIPIAEETGFIVEIDKWTLLQVCKQNKAWQDAGCAKIPIAINISAKHFSQLNFLDLIKSVLEETRLEPQYVIIEITEGSALESEEYVVETIQKLKQLGIKVSIDDFGRGYSSINQLITLSVSEIKIDRDFVHGVRGDHKKEIVVKILIDLAHQLNLNVVAEGIETVEELSYLLERNCDEIQGYLISRPLPSNQVIHFLNEKGEMTYEEIMDKHCATRYYANGRV